MFYNWVVSLLYRKPHFTQFAWYWENYKTSLASVIIALRWKSENKLNAEILQQCEKSVLLAVNKERLYVEVIKDIY